MGDGDMHRADAGAFHDVARSSAEVDLRRTFAVVADLDIAPADAAPPAGAQGLQHGLFCGPAAGIMLCGGFSRRAVFDLVVGVDARNKELAVALNHLSDSQAFGDVDSSADDGH